MFSQRCQFSLPFAHILIYPIKCFIYPIKCLLSFYNAYARSVNCYGLLVYGSAVRTNLEKIEMAQRRIIRTIFFKRKFDNLQNILCETELNTVFELFILNVFRETFSQLTFKGTTKISKRCRFETPKNAI